jgi:hypothetical protein
MRLVIFMLNVASADVAGGAFNDFHSGKFGDIPRQARLKYR